MIKIAIQSIKRVSSIESEDSLQKLKWYKRNIMPRLKVYKISEKETIKSIRRENTLDNIDYNRVHHYQDFEYSEYPLKNIAATNILCNLGGTFKDFKENKELY